MEVFFAVRAGGGSDGQYSRAYQKYPVAFGSGSAKGWWTRSLHGVHYGTRLNADGSRYTWDDTYGKADYGSAVAFGSGSAGSWWLRAYSVNGYSDEASRLTCYAGTNGNISWTNAIHMQRVAFGICYGKVAQVRLANGG